MSNDIQPNQPVTLSLHPDTQIIQQTGEKNVFANHVDNLNVTLQTLNTPPQLITQAPKPATLSLNNEYYNLIVGGEMDFYNIQPFTLSIDRSLKEYMGDELVKEFPISSSETQKRVLTFPSIFANENISYGHTDEYQVLGLGYIRQLKVRHEAVKIYPHIIYLLPQQRLNESLFDLDIRGNSSFNEFNRTHWCIKKVDLIAELRELGFQL